MTSLIPRFSAAPEAASPQTRRNYVAVQREAAIVGILVAAGPFLPVLFARLGGSSFQVSLLTSLPAVAGVFLAIPVGRIVQGRGSVVTWYAWSRALSFLSYGAMAVIIFVAPSQLAVPLCLVAWAIATVPVTVSSVAFPAVMDGAAGPRGRLDLLGRRWALMGGVSAVSVAVTGIVLDLLPFPGNYQLVFIVFSIAGVVGSAFALQIRIPPGPDRPHSKGISLGGRMRAFVGLVRGERQFLLFSVRQLSYMSGLRMAAPLVPLYYVRELSANDGWIGIIGTLSAVGALTGYELARRVSRVRGTRPVLLAATFGAGAWPILLSQLGILPVVAGFAGLAAVAVAAAELVVFDELMHSIPAAHQVTFASVDTTFQNAGAIVAPILGALIADAIGLDRALIVAGSLSILGWMLFALAGHRGKR